MKAIKKYKKGGKMKGSSSNPSIDYNVYQGATGKSMSQQVSEKMWASKASADELKLGSVTTRDAGGNYITRTRTSSKA
jgi:hypothetical protein